MDIVDLPDPDPRARRRIGAAFRWQPGCEFPMQENGTSDRHVEELPWELPGERVRERIEPVYESGDSRVVVGGVVSQHLVRTGHGELLEDDSLHPVSGLQDETDEPHELRSVGGRVGCEE